VFILDIDADVRQNIDEKMPSTSDGDVSPSGTADPADSASHSPFMEGSVDSRGPDNPDSIPVEQSGNNINFPDVLHDSESVAADSDSMADSMADSIVGSPASATANSNAANSNTPNTNTPDMLKSNASQPNRNLGSAESPVQTESAESPIQSNYISSRPIPNYISNARRLAEGRRLADGLPNRYIPTRIATTGRRPMQYKEQIYPEIDEYEEVVLVPFPKKYFNNYSLQSLIVDTEEVSSYANGNYPFRNPVELHEIITITIATGICVFFWVILPTCLLKMHGWGRVGSWS
jgi:hypothetical protein